MMSEIEHTAKIQKAKNRLRILSRKLEERIEKTEEPLSGSNLKLDKGRIQIVYLFKTKAVQSQKSVQKEGWSEPFV